MNLPVLSGLSRDATLDALERERFDLVVIGGGITGAGIAREAGRRGLRVALFEAVDFACGTSSRSSKLIHGGLRYLAMGEVGLVRETALERKAVHRLAPHLAEPRWMLLPVRSRTQLLKFRAAITAYEKLGAVDRADAHQNWGADELAREEPALDREAFPYACAYREYLTDDARLVLANLRAAAQLGAVAINHAPVDALIVEGGRAVGVEAACVLCGRRVRALGRAVINAAGPWVEVVRRLEVGSSAPWLHLSSGVHVGLPAERLPVNHMVAISASDRRTVFAIRRGAVTYVGTTDRTYAHGPETWPRIRRDEVTYLLEPLARYFDAGALRPEDVVSAWSGIRPLVAEPGKAPHEISRKDEIVIGPQGLVSIAGGKLTGYRPMATGVLEKAAGLLGQKLPAAGDDPPLPGGDFAGDLDALARQLLDAFATSPALAARTARLYGSEAGEVIAGGPEPLAGDLPVCSGEVDWAVEREGAVTLEDLVYRRLRAPLFLPGAEKLLAPAALRLGAKLGWDAARVDREVEGMRARLRADLAFEDGPIA